MLSQKRIDIANSVIQSYLEDSEEYPNVQAINESVCGEFSCLLNESYQKEGLAEHTVYSTYDFISPEVDSGDCEYVKDWKEESLLQLGVPLSYFQEYRRKLKEIDKREVVGYHVWMFDGERHYDATCLEGVQNPLELHFFQIFIK